MHKAIMVRFKSCNKFLKLKTEENWFAYVRQPIYCVKSLC